MAHQRALDITEALQGDIEQLSQRARDTSWTCAAILRCSKKKKEHLRKALINCKYPKWALDKMEKRLNRSSRQANDGGNNNAQSANHEVQNKGHIIIPYTQGLCESIKRSVVGMASKLTSKVAEPSKTWSPPMTKTPMVNQSGAIYWYQCGDLGLWWWVHRGNLQDLWWKIQRAPEDPLCHSPPLQPNRPYH